MGLFSCVWRSLHHEHIAPGRLQDLRYELVWEFYRNAMRKEYVDEQIRNFIIFCRWAASNRMHHMSGGTRPLSLDSCEDHLADRRSVFDVGKELPLPDNLKLSENEAQFNRIVDWKRKSA